MSTAAPTPPTREQRALKAAICEEPADLYSAAGREAFGRVLAQVISGMGVTPSEVLHSASLQSQIANAGQTLMQAVQKAAIAQVKGTSVPVSQRVRALFDLSDRVQAETRERIAALDPKPISADDIPDLLRYVPDESDEERRFRIVATLTATIVEKGDWVRKFDTLFELARDVAGMDAFQVFDGMIAEIIRFPIASQSILGRSKTGADELDRLVGLYSGSLGPTDAPPQPPPARNLYALLFADPMPETRSVILDQIVHIATGKDALTNGPVERELDAVMAAQKLLKRDGTYLGGDEVEKALEARASRQLSDETIELLMAPIPNQGERILKALELHESVPGEKARVYLETYVTALMREADSDKKLLDGLRDPLDKLIRLGRLHGALKTSTLPANVIERLSERFQKLQATVLATDKVMEAIAIRARTPADQAMLLVKLIGDGIFIPGENATEARKRAQQMIARKGFLDEFLDGAEQSDDRKRRLVELQAKLSAAGLG